MMMMMMMMMTMMMMTTTTFTLTRTYGIHRNAQNRHQKNTPFIIIAILHIQIMTTTSWTEDMGKALKDETFHDVILFGNDENNYIEKSRGIPCSKLILSTRSPVFKTMFYGDFKERDSNVVKLQYPSVVIHVLVHYCYTDEIFIDFLAGNDDLYKKNHGRDVLELERQNPQEMDDFRKNLDSDVQQFLFTESGARLLVQLRDAANYFQLPMVYNFVTEQIGTLLFHTTTTASTKNTASSSSLKCACAMLAELQLRGGHGEGQNNDGALFRIMLEVIRSQPEECLLSSSSSLSQNSSSNENNNNGNNDTNSSNNNGVVLFPASLLKKILDKGEDPNDVGKVDDKDENENETIDDPYLVRNFVDNPYTVVRCLQLWFQSRHEDYHQEEDHHRQKQDQKGNHELQQQEET